MSWIGVIIVGMTIGLLGSLVAPRTPSQRSPFGAPIWLAVGCGAAGVLVGWAVGGDGHPVLRWLASLLLAGVLVAAALAEQERDRTRV